jgi:hypothetical protein
VFSENDRRNALLGSLTIFVMIFACAASIRLYKLAVPEHVDGDTVSFSQAAFEQALARWQAAGVQSYEMTIRSGDELVVLRVSDGGESVKVVQHLYDDRAIDEQRISPYSARLRTMTVEHLFAMAQGTDTGAPPTGANRAPGEDTTYFYDSDRRFDERLTYFYDFNMRFDERLGYPNYMSQYERTTRPSREITWRVNLRPPLEVKALTVLESR